MNYTSNHTGGNVTLQYEYIYDLNKLFGNE